MASNPYGIGIQCTSDFPVTMQIVGSTRIVVEALYRRFITDTGALAFIGDDPNYGLNLRTMINDEMNPATIAAWNQAIVAQCMQEETIFSANSSILFSPQTSTADVTISVSLFNGGTFKLVLSVNEVTAQLMSVSNS